MSIEKQMGELKVAAINPGVTVSVPFPIHGSSKHETHIDRLVIHLR
jgi:hypothetical protein